MAAVMKSLQRATFASGCFWCGQELWSGFRGVENAVAGYTGGNVHNPTYEQVCQQLTGHTEAIQLLYDDSVISYDTLLEIFFHMHDPTSFDKQDNDVGSNYRSVIYFHTEEQKKLALEKIAYLNNESMEFEQKPIVTKLLPAATFFPAEDYHQYYFRKKPNDSYCSLAIAPKMKALYQRYRHLLK